MHRWRPVAGVAAAAVVAFVASVVLGEYSLTIPDAVAAAVIIPVAVGESLAAVAGSRNRAWQWVATAGLAGAAAAWGTWLSDGRGLQPWPAGGWVAVGLGSAWPLALALRSYRTVTVVSDAT